MNKDNLVEVGKIVKAFGLRGELKVHPEVFLEDFLLFNKFLVISQKGGKKHLTVESIRRGAGDSLIVKFKEIDSREMAEKLKGFKLLVYEEELPETQEEEFYIKDLIGCSIFEDDKNLGQVVDYLNQGLSGSLVVISQDEREVFIPFVKRYVKAVDISKKTIKITGFDELKNLNP
ncbi:MAG: ribosome maturation factor RimM [Candidatus Hydrothermia bacterium]